MIRTGLRALAALSVFAACLSAGAGAEGWHKSLDDGIEAAKKSGKPLLVVTGWKSGV